MPNTPAPSQPVKSTSDDKVILVTKEGLQKLNEELDMLKNVRRKEVAERLKEAISYGDLSENSEYEEAKNDQAFIEGRIAELEEKIKFAQIIEDYKKGSTEEVQLGSTVTIKNVGGKKVEEEEYTIVGSTEADPINFKISNESPVGKALLGRRIGESVAVMVPAGKKEYEILNIV